MNKITKTLAGFVAVAAFAVVAVSPASAMTTAELQAQIAALTAQLNAASGSSATASVTFTRDLSMGATGADVTALQNLLISKGYAIPAGATGYYGAQTAAAVKAWQMSAGLPATGYFGPMSRAAVNAMAGTGSTGSTGTGSTGTSSSLQGGAGSITVSDKSTYSSEEVLEGQEDAKVLAFEVEADDESDVEVTSVKVELEQTTTADSENIDDYIESVSVWLNGKKVGEADADDFSENSDVYTKSISLNGAIVKAGEKEDFVVAVTALSNLDSGDIDTDAFTVDVLNVRFEDAEGVVSTENTDTDNLEQTFDFEDLASSGDLELTVEEGDEDVNGVHTVKVDDSSDTDGVDVLNFTIEADGSDMTLNDLDIAIVSSGAGVTEIANDFQLMMGDKEVGTMTIDGGSFASSTDTTRTLTVTDLDDDDVVVEEGDTVEFTLVADINDIDGGFTSGDYFDSVTVDSANVDADDENGDTVTDLTGTADSDDIKFISAGIVVTTTSKSASADTKVSDVATDDQGVFEVEFKVEALEDSAYIELGSGTRGTTESNTGFNFVLQDEPNSYAATTTGSIALSEVTRVSGGSLSGEFVKISAGSSATFKAKVTFDPAHVTGSSVGYRMRLYSVNYAATAVDATAQEVLTPEVDYRTGAVSVGN